ncbi:hypothetical protein SELMODRAFT_409171 [Selaginella moellendorffii]|uniref:Integral membrane protein TmpA n=1 Tax=Selaginella moellendorffii TaxID=88036 RepID=D8RAL0_SELML|nr:adenylate-forming reductase 03009 [Selaginella moellendorffii]EFJ30639.1 hypothetical protein SELMODRAFT_409171 [Selaginella moellendorffii]|eukprot:XP_002968385.1 adenylate-forming reductase 03009 [Selaginella moellendorffii]
MTNVKVEAEGSERGRIGECSATAIERIMEFAAQELHEESTTRRMEKRLNVIVEKNRLGAGWGRRFGFGFTLYNVWWLVIFPVNLAIVAALFSIDLRVNRAELATAMALVNLLAVAAIRDGTVLLLLYKIVVRIPWKKYFFNRMLHCNGGIHTGCAIMLLVWTTTALILPIANRGDHGRIADGIDAANVAMLAVLVAGLSIMMILAMPIVRVRHHNLFERVHRYLGWSLLLLLTAILLRKFFHSRWNLSGIAIASATIAIACLLVVFYSWFLIERQSVHVRVGRQGNVLIVRLHGKARPGAFAKISFNLTEWHAFSVAFSDRENRAYGLVVGVAGDWTQNLAQRCLTRLDRSVSKNRAQVVDEFFTAPPDLEAPPSTESSSGETTIKAFIRWHRPLGFMYSVYAYKRVICVGTGAGIAPILPHIGSDRVAIHVVWIAKKHRGIYGDEICDRVFQHSHTIYDTAEMGRPKPEIALASYEEFRAEAIFVVSNAKFTEAVRDVCKTEKIVAFGAVFDS